MLIKPREALARLAIKYKGDWNKIHDAMRSRESAEEECYAPTCDYVTILDPEYPAKFRDCCEKPPFVLFYKGDLSLIQDEAKCAYIVGTRMPSENGLHAVREIVWTLNENGYAVISHNARGTDIEALQQAKRPVCVLGNGFGYSYPVGDKKTLEEIAERGLLISEYPPDAEPTATNFVSNKRVASALCKAVICGEVASRSGSLVSVSYALNMGKDVGAIPMPYGSQTANNMLISQGATLIAKPQDALAMF